MNEFSAAIALAQFESTKVSFLEKEYGNKIFRIVSKTDYLIPQKIEKKSYSTFYTAAVKLKENKKVSWEKFKKKFISFGGKDGIYAPAQLLCDEPIIKRLKIEKCFKNCKKGLCQNLLRHPCGKKITKKIIAIHH